MMVTPPDQNPQPAALLAVDNPRADRLTAQLRANLARRKGQARARSGAEATAPEADGAPAPARQDIEKA